MYIPTSKSLMAILLGGHHNHQWYLLELKSVSDVTLLVPEAKEAQRQISSSLLILLRRPNNL